jgi:hypothetical protein
VIGTGALSTMLLQGDRLDWFDSRLICVLALVSAIGILLLLVNEWFHPLPLLKLQMLGRRNIAYGTPALFAFLVIGQSGSSVPLRYLQEVQSYRPLQSNLLTLEIAALQLVMLPAMALLLGLQAARFSRRQPRRVGVDFGVLHRFVLSHDLLEPGPILSMVGLVGVGKSGSAPRYAFPRSYVYLRM